MSVESGPLDDATFNIGQRMGHYECALVELSHDALDFADLQPGDYTVQDVMLHAAVSAIAPVYCNTPIQLPCDPFADQVAVVGDNRDGGVFLNAVDHEIESFCRSDIGEDRVEGRFNPQH